MILNAVLDENLPQLNPDATNSQILSGYQALTENGDILTGTMTNNGAISQTLNAGDSYIVPEGYHNGSGKITANSLASQTSATATTDDIASGKTAWVNGSKITGTASSGGSNVVIEPLTASTCVFTNTSSTYCSVVITTSQNIGEIVGLNAYTQWLEVVNYPYVQKGDTLDEADFVINDCNMLHYINDDFTISGNKLTITCKAQFQMTTFFGGSISYIPA